MGRNRDRVLLDKWLDNWQRSLSPLLPDAQLYPHLHNHRQFSQRLWIRQHWKGPGHPQAPPQLLCFFAQCGPWVTQWVSAGDHLILPFHQFHRIRLFPIFQKTDILNCSRFESHLTPGLADAEPPVWDTSLGWGALNTLRSSSNNLLMLYSDGMLFSQV